MDDEDDEDEDEDFLGWLFLGLVLMEVGEATVALTTGLLPAAVVVPLKKIK